MADCRRGLIDRVLVKSISRFARNTKECLETIRELKSLGVGVYFEKENIDSAVDSREYETVRLRRVFSGRQPMTALDAELLQSSVSAIHCHNDGSLNIKLKNRQVIGKE